MSSKSFNVANCRTFNGTVNSSRRKTGNSDGAAIACLADLVDLQTQVCVQCQWLNGVVSPGGHFRQLLKHSKNV